MYALFYKDERPGQWKLHDAHHHAFELEIAMREKFSDRMWWEAKLIGFLDSLAIQTTEQLFSAANAILSDESAGGFETWIVREKEIPA